MDKKESLKPNCFDCNWRGRVPGSSHSQCNHPKNKEVLGDNTNQLLSIFASVGRVAPVSADTGLNVTGKQRGIEMGWFNWPFNFDPVWLESCDGFEEKE